MTEENQQSARLHPQGIFKAKGIAGSESFGKSVNQNDQVSIGLMMADTGRTLTTILTFSDKSEGYSKDRLVALGWTGEFDEHGGFVGIDRNEVQVQVSYEPYQDPETGLTEEKIRVEIVSGRFQFKESMDDAGKRAFQSRMRNLYAKSGSGAPSPGGAAQGGAYPADWDKSQGGGAAVDKPNPLKL